MIIGHIALMHMTMRMLDSVMGMGVLVFEVAMLVCAVGVGMGQCAVTVCVGMGLDVGVFVGHIPVPFLFRVGSTAMHAYQHAALMSGNAQSGMLGVAYRVQYVDTPAVPAHRHGR
ncbi:hypothetical protein [Nocardia sp. NBC_00403]|uniref:hypothetical protein n=1 Tax=Nocardia sp. NBC_00403 TaxID=2975990 RepID=UPI003FA604FE